MKTSELKGAALDWAVAKCEGLVPLISKHRTVEGAISVLVKNRLVWEPTYNWVQGGPIIEREGISLEFKSQQNEWHAIIDTRPEYTRGQYLFVRWHKTSPLIAAMRCYVASKLGDEVDVPEELR
mgnify:CR=1 FL=1